jgi:hypothetical protein
MQTIFGASAVKCTKPNFDWQHQFNDERNVIEPMQYTLAKAKERKD